MELLPLRVPGAAAPPPNTSRCRTCGGDLLDTRLSGRPRRDDHIPKCGNLRNANAIMRYAEELEQAAHELRESGASRGDQARGSWFEKRVEQLKAAACTSDAIWAAELALREVAKKAGAHAAEDISLLEDALQALERRRHPAPVILPSG
jgi:hypothetical protein